ncbi:NUDIX domain-containing protein [Methanotorris formicicus]|nr:NUDIX hydrolase [Methanotorris formicicus]
MTKQNKPKCMCICGKKIALSLKRKRYSKKLFTHRMLKKYNLYPSPSLTVDGIIEINNKILLIKRKKHPFKDFWALPGGFVECGETVEEAVIREVEEETGLKTKVKKLLGVYSNPNRDPRGHTISVVFVLDVVGGEILAGDDAKDAGLFDLNNLPKLAFDHENIIKDYLKQIGGKT